MLDILMFAANYFLSWFVVGLAAWSVIDNNARAHREHLLGVTDHELPSRSPKAVVIVCVLMIVASMMQLYLNTLMALVFQFLLLTAQAYNLRFAIKEVM